MLRHELYSMIHVPRFKDENATELFLGLRIGTVGSCHFAVFPIQGQRSFLRLKRFSTSPVPLWREDGRRIQSMRRTWRFARPQPCHQICLYRSIPDRRISLFFSSSFRVGASGVASRWLV